MASQGGEFHSRAVEDVLDDFKRQHGQLLQGQHLQFSASCRHRTRELESYAANRAEAIKQHEADIKAIDEREKRLQST